MFMVYHDVSKYVGPASTLKRNHSTAGGWFITFDRKCGATPCVDFAPVHFCFGLVACSRGGNLAKTCKNRSRNVAFVLTAWPLLRTNKPSTKSLPGTWRDFLLVYTVIWIDDFSSCRPPWRNEKHILHDFIAVYGPRSRQTNSAERWVAKLKNEKHHHDSAAGCKAIQRHQYDNTRRPKSKIQTSHHRATTMLPIRPHRCWLKPYS